MNIRKSLIYAAVASSALLFSTTQAEEMIYSGFMSDYSQLEKVTDGTADYRYLAPDAADRMIKYNAVMIDQPEIFIAIDSQYRGIKPKHLDALAESLRAGLAAGLGEHVYVVDRPMENVLYLSVAITNLKLLKIKKKPYNYVPVAFVVGSVKGAATSDIAKKANLHGLVFELEVFDSVSGERLVALIDHLGGVADEPQSWEDVDALMVAYGELIACRFNNAQLPPEQKVNCLTKD